MENSGDMVEAIVVPQNTTEHFGTETGRQKGGRRGRVPPCLKAKRQQLKVIAVAFLNPLV
jgi:hypothetical protein